MITHYQSSRGPVLISSMVYTHANNALAKLRRDEPGRVDEINALMDHLDELDAARQDTQGDPPAPIGHNAPPDEPEAPTAASWPALRAHLDDLLTEARVWADGTPIETDAQADELARLRDQLRKGVDLADAARKAEREPHDVVIEEIQARFNAYIAPLKNKTPGKVSVALDALGHVATAWLRKKEAEQAAEAERLRAEAQAKMDAAAQAIRSSVGNIEAREEAEALFTEAKQTERAAVRAETAPVHAFGEGRATGLRDNWVTTIADGLEASRWLFVNYRADLEALALAKAQAEVRAGKRQIQGFTIVNERRV